MNNTQLEVNNMALNSLSLSLPILDQHTTEDIQFPKVTPRLQLEIQASIMQILILL